MSDVRNALEGSNGRSDTKKENASEQQPYN